MMPVRRSAALRFSPALVATALLAGCDPEVPPEYTRYLDVAANIPACDPTLTIAADSPALMVHDPEALQALPLEKVLTHLLDSEGDKYTSPLQLLQRLFDTSNQEQEAAYPSTLHCDSEGNPAHLNGPAAFCPRVEGALAFSDGLLTPGHADFFYPVAAVNRFDLTPLGGGSCGEYRLVYAKTSGLENPNDRVFLIFEASLPNPRSGSLLACRPVLEYWKSLEQETDKAVLGEKLATFFFDGLPGFPAPMIATNLGFGTGPGTSGSVYYGTSGQVRLSQHMDEHWEMRQLIPAALEYGSLTFAPVLVGNNPLPALFEPGQTYESDFGWFADDFGRYESPALAASRVEDITMAVTFNYLAGESALGGEPMNDYEARAVQNFELHDAIRAGLHDVPEQDCPTDDPLTSNSILRRASMMSCAGCHSPERFLGPDRKIGCGLTWPASLGEVHVDERGQISPALRDVFLPKRAHLLETYLQACDEAAILEAFGVDPASGQHIKSARPRTLGGTSVH